MPSVPTVTAPEAEPAPSASLLPVEDTEVRGGRLPCAEALKCRRPVEPGEAALEGLDQSPARLDGAELGLDLLWMGSQSAWFGLSSVCAFCMQLLLPIWGCSGVLPSREALLDIKVSLLSLTFHTDHYCTVHTPTLDHCSQSWRLGVALTK